MSKGVQKRIQRSRSVILAGYVYADITAEAWRRRQSSHLDHLLAHGEIRRVEHWRSEIRDQENGSSATLADIFRFVARDIEEAGEWMITCDEILNQRRAALRRAWRRRDRLANELYSELSQTRKFFMGLLRHQKNCPALDLAGPTPRDPEALLHWAHTAIKALADPERAPAREEAKGGRLETSVFAERLSTRREALRAAVAAVTSADYGEAQALQAKQFSIVAFDKDHLRGARLLESVLDIVGLPSLAETVRPGVKRRGRPPKKRPIDVYPDLVKRMLGQDTRECPLQITTGKLGDPPSLQAGALPTKNPQRKIEQDPRKRSAGEEKSEQGSHKLSKGEEKSEQGSHKRSKGEEKSEQGSHKLSRDEGKNEHGSRKRSSDHRKIENPLHKLTERASRSASERLKLRERDHRSRRRIVHGLASRPLRTQHSMRPVRPPTARNKLAQTASTWWRRLSRQLSGTTTRRRK